MQPPSDPTTSDTPPIDARLRCLLDAGDRAAATLPEAGEALQRLSARIEEAQQPTPASPKTPGLRHRTGRRRSWLAVSVIALVAITVSVPALRTSLSHWWTSAPQEYTTARAQQRTLDLPDGSRVVLAPATSLRYSVDRAGQRVAELSGQAYFTVTHDPSQPFLVRTATTTTRVLGTAFVVRAYAEDEVTQVAVSEGRVALGSDAETVVLLAGDVGRATPEAPPRLTHDLSISDVFGWMRGQLTFRNAPLRDVAAELERTYDLEIRFADPSLADRPVTATFAGGSAGTMLDAITIAADVRYRRNGRMIELFTNAERAQ